MKKLEVDTELIRGLAALLEETGLSEIELGEGDRRIRVVRNSSPSPAAAAAAVATAAEGAAAPPDAKPAAPAAVDADHPGAVTSPMVGTVYLAPEPGAPPFVNVGDMVKKGQTLIIIEAMKHLNPIRAPRAGSVKRILVENGAPIEYGQALLILE